MSGEHVATHPTMPPPSPRTCAEGLRSQARKERKVGLSILARAEELEEVADRLEER